MQEYNVRAELDARFPIADNDIDALVDPLMDLLEDYGGTVARTPDGRPELIFTVPADSVRQACSTGLAVVTAEGYRVFAVEVMPQAEFARRSQLVPMPELVSVPQAAEMLGLSRQRVLQLINAGGGQLEAVKVGDTWVLSKAAVEARIAALRPAEVVTYQ